MSEVKRHTVDRIRLGNYTTVHTETLVLVTDFDAEHALRIAAERKVSRIDTLFDAVAHGDEAHRAWLEEAIKAHMAELPMPKYVGASKDDLERQVGELQRYKPLSLREYELRTKLDTAIGLLRDCYDSICNPDEYRKVGAFLNTTSTEGKDHE